MDAFTDDITKTGVPTFASEAVFQQPVTNMNVYSSNALLNGEGLNGNLEFWPTSHGAKNAAHVSDASETLYDFGDKRYDIYMYADKCSWF